MSAGKVERALSDLQDAAIELINHGSGGYADEVEQAMHLLRAQASRCMALERALRDVMPLVEFCAEENDECDEGEDPECCSNQLCSQLGCVVMKHAAAWSALNDSTGAALASATDSKAGQS
jgi:hypothetical protein